MPYVPLLTAAEAARVVSIIADDAKPLEDKAAAFAQAFTSRPDQHRACCALTALIEDNLLLTPAQRIVSLFLLADGYKGEQPGAQPFLPHLIDAASNVAGTPAERYFALHLLSSGAPQPRELITWAAADVVSHYESLAAAPSFALPPHAAVHSTFYPPALAAAAEAASRGLPALGRVALSGAAVMDSLPAPPPTAAEAETDRAAASRARLTAASPMGLQPIMGWPAPGLTPLGSDEFPLLQPGPMPGELPLLWDNNLAAPGGGRGAAVAETVARACRAPLLPAAQASALTLLESDPGLVHSCGASPRRLPDLVEHNPALATEILVRLAACGGRRLEPFLEALLGLETSLHAMEVVSRLATAVELPPGFLRSYILHCISCCEAVRDKYHQNRLVRLLCVFLNNLFRSRVVSAADLFVEVQAFCVDFSRIREAASLFRTLKALESPGGGGGGLSPNSAAPLSIGGQNT